MWFFSCSLHTCTYVKPYVFIKRLSCFCHRSRIQQKDKILNLAIAFPMLLQHCIKQIYKFWAGLGGDYCTLIAQTEKIFFSTLRINNKDYNPGSRFLHLHPRTCRFVKEQCNVLKCEPNLLLSCTADSTAAINTRKSPIFLGQKTYIYPIFEEARGINQ